MKKVGPVLIFVLFISFTLAGFAQPAAGSDNLGRLQPVKLSADCDDFQFKSHITESVKLAEHGRLQVALCSNASTGYSWSDSARISDHTVIWQTSHSTRGSSGGALGAPGQETWTFQALNQGTTTISLEYSKPKAGLGSSKRTYEIKVQVVDDEDDDEDDEEKSGKDLVKQFFTYVNNSNLSLLENSIARDFQAVDGSGIKNRKEELEALKKADLGSYSLGNFKTTRRDDLLIVSYTLSAERTITGRKLPGGSGPRMSTFVKTDSGWKLIAHAAAS